MLYIVKDENGTLFASSYMGKYFGEDDVKFFKKLAGRFGYDSITVDGKVEKSNYKSGRVTFSGMLEVVPYVYIKGDIAPSSSLKIPFINDRIFIEHLATVDYVPGLLIPYNFKQYVTAEEPKSSIQLEHPVGIYNREVVSSFPYDLPVPYIGTDVIFAYTQGMLELYPLYEDMNKFKGFLREQGVYRFITIDSIKDQLDSPSYRLDDKKSVVFFLPNMEELKPGVFYGKNLVNTTDPRGIGVDTNMGEILTCLK